MHVNCSQVAFTVDDHYQFFFDIGVRVTEFEVQVILYRYSSLYTMLLSAPHW